MTEPNTVLSQALATNRALGEDLQSRAYSLADPSIAGFIDAVSVDEAGRCWVLGWAKAEIGDAMGVLIVDRAKYPGSLVLARFPRDGLEPGATGFIGVLQSDWQPQIETAQVAIVLSAGRQPHLRNSGDALRRVGILTFGQIVEAAQAGMVGAYRDDISNLLKSPESWVPGTSRVTNTTVDMAIDNVVAIPGVGCVVEGWAVSPRQAITGFSLRAGSVVSRADMRSSFRVPRPDLASGFPRAAETLRDAGFVAFFPLTDLQALTREMILKLHLGRQESVNFVLPEQKVMWLHRRAGEEVLLRCYPSLDCEPFFPAMAAMLKRAALMQATRPVIWRATPTPRAMVVAIADHPDEPYRVMDCLDQWRGLAREKGVGFVLLAPESRRRNVLKLLKEWPQGEGEPSLSLFFQTSDIVSPMDISLILKALEAKAAVIVREGVRLEVDCLVKCLTLLDDVSDESAAHSYYATTDLPQARQCDGPAAMVWSFAALDRAARAGLGWAELATTDEPAGEVERAIRPPTKRRMLRVLQQAGVKL